MNLNREENMKINWTNVFVWGFIIIVSSLFWYAIISRFMEVL
jgi:hypothetical protein